MHIVKTPPYQQSKLGVSFGMQAIYSMRWWVAEFQKHEDPLTILWCVRRDPDGQLRAGLAADPDPYLDFPADEIDGLQFRWVVFGVGAGNELNFDMVRDKYCIDYDVDKRTPYLTPKGGSAPTSKPR